MKFSKKQLQGSMDQAASALALNCFQLGFGIQDVPLCEYSCNNADWMTKLTAAAPNLKLRDVVIPGTHDSASYTISKMQPFAAVGRTQNVSCYDQLCRGCRYLDIRVGGGSEGDNDVRIFHGFLKGGKVSDVMDDISRFVDENPGEFIFLDIVLEYGREMSATQRIAMFDMVKTICGSRLITIEDKKKWFRNNQVNLGQIAKYKKNFLVLVHNRIYGFSHEGNTYDEEYIKTQYNFYHTGRSMRNKWHNTMDLQTLLTSNEEDLEQYKEKRNFFHNSSFVFTPGFGGPNDIPPLLLGLKSLRPVSYARILYKFDVLDDHLRAKADDPFNLVTFDFVDLCPALVCFLIGLNFPSKLTVFEATAKSHDNEIDVAEKLKNHIKRGACLYLTSIQSDLGLESAEGELSVTFSFDRDAKQHQTISFNEDTEYLLTKISQNAGDCNLCE